jgi:hypothetical protein
LESFFDRRRSDKCHNERASARARNHLSTDLRFLVQQREDAHPALNQINARLVIVKVDKRPGDLLADVLVLLQLKNVLVELLLQLLVGVVDTKLLKAVDFEGFKAVNVQDADEPLCLDPFDIGRKRLKVLEGKDMMRRDDGVGSGRVKRGPMFAFLCTDLIDARHHPVKHVGVNVFCQSVSRANRIFRRLRLGEDLVMENLVRGCFDVLAAPKLQRN